MNSLKFDKRRVIGQRIVRIELNRFRADSYNSPNPGRWAYDPIIYLENGKAIRFVVQETEVGEYGVMPVIVNVGEMED